MNETYIKAGALGAVLIAGLLFPSMAAAALTGVAWWMIKDKTLSEYLLVRQIIAFLPQDIQKNLAK